MPYFPLKCNFHDRVRQPSKSQGLGDFVMTQRYACSRRFNDVFSINDNVYYLIHDCDECDDSQPQLQESGNWEIGCAPYSGTAIERSSPNAIVFSSSNGDAPVDFPDPLESTYAVEHIVPADWFNAILKMTQCQNPAGQIVDYAGANIPEGWILADGANLLRADYPELFAAIGTVWNLATDTDTTLFRLPDLCGKVTVGAGDCLGTSNSHPNAADHDHMLGEYGGQEYSVLTGAQLPTGNHIEFRILMNSVSTAGQPILTGSSTNTTTPYTGVPLVPNNGFRAGYGCQFNGIQTPTSEHGPAATQVANKPIGFTLSYHPDSEYALTVPNGGQDLFRRDFYTQRVQYDWHWACETNQGADSAALTRFKGAEDEPASNLQPYAGLNKIIYTGKCSNGQFL